VSAAFSEQVVEIAATVWICKANYQCRKRFKWFEGCFIILSFFAFKYFISYSCLISYFCFPVRIGSTDRGSHE
jgi:hypothetical protein